MKWEWIAVWGGEGERKGEREGSSVSTLIKRVREKRKESFARANRSDGSGGTAQPKRE